MTSAKNGMDLIRNIKRMYAGGDGHVLVFAASIRSPNHLLCSFHYRAELVTVPAKVLEEWADQHMPLPDKDYTREPVGQAVPYENLKLDQPWESFEIRHELTTNSIQKLVADYRSILRQSS